MNVNILKRNEAGFPDILTQIAYPPDQLYWSGIAPSEWLAKPKLAVVGSRKATPYGRTVTTKLVRELAQSGAVIVSGLAYGIDICAHQAALAVNGVTVAVLPTGLDQIYPAAHQHIANTITEHGTLITEYGPRTNGFRSNFIARNRIVSGLADVLLITEAAVNSGSLHTAGFALAQGKTVMAVPGNINSPISEGCNNLIKSGALPVTSVEDVLFALKINTKTAKTRLFSGSEQERMIFDLIKEGLGDQEKMAVATSLDGPQLASALTMLEISGHIRPTGGGNWVIS